VSYLVLARKWRSKTFDEVVGQEHVTQTLKNAIERDRVAHALLFTGSRGIGKTSCARILAKSLNCEQGPTTEPCGVCQSCIDITNGTSVDVFEIDGASNNGVEQVRELRESVKFVSTRGKRKMYIIDEVHMLSTAAFNALLKTLEEPPPHVLFVFATTEPHKIPDTIHSRCQRYDFKRISEKRIVAHLMHIAEAEGINVEPEALQHIAREAKGGMRDSLSLFDQVIAFCGESISGKQTQEVLGVADRRTLHELTESILRGDSQRALEITEGLFEFGIDLQKFAGEFVGHLRDLMVIRTCANPERLVDLPSTEVQALSAQVAPVAPARIHRLFSALMKGADEISRSAFPKLVFEMTLLRLCNQGQTLPLAEVLEGLSRLEARLDAPVPPEGPGPVPPSSPGGGAPGGGRPTRATPARSFTPPPPVGSPQRAEAPASTPSHNWAPAADAPAEPAPARPVAQPAPAKPITQAAPTRPVAQPAPTKPAPAQIQPPSPPKPKAQPSVATVTAPSAGITGLQSAGDGKSHGPVRAVDSVAWPPPAEMGLTREVVAEAARRAGAKPSTAQAQPAPARMAQAAAPTPTQTAALPSPAMAEAPNPAPMAQAAVGAPAIELEPAVTLLRMPRDLHAPLDRFEHFISQLIRSKGAFLAKAIEHEARLERFDDAVLALGFPEEAFGLVEDNRLAFEETLSEVLGHPITLALRIVERGEPAYDIQTLYARRQQRLNAARDRRKQAARRDPAIVRLVEQLGAEVVELVIPQE
jgi:DNA polymerase III subunit gamma/tau